MSVQEHALLIERMRFAYEWMRLTGHMPAGAV